MEKIIKKFSGQKTELIATTTNIDEATELLKDGWEIINVTQNPINSEIGTLVFIGIYTLIKN